MDRLQIYLTLSMATVLFSMLLVERRHPARAFPLLRHWLLYGLGVILIFVCLANAWSVLVPKGWLRQHRLIDGEPLGVAAGLLVWYPANTFVTYWYHRFQHRSSITWRLLHQVHHGVPRVDLPSALMAHPLDVIVSATVSIIVGTFLLGLSLQTIAVANMLQFVMALFPHWNVRTPRWVGYIVQRPEEHILHHERGVHAGNYADWPLWDKLFGTYRSPVDGPVVVSFEHAGWRDQIKMLAFVDVNTADYR